ncbi:hypothetical protein HD806DRAFT_537060 [Xylariaceae sp. AK1471]|nr:hypothetical protein HD806DRAFT_537060 [Xylariaceae sp. AK1471]
MAKESQDEPNFLSNLKSDGITLHEPRRVEYERPVAASKLLYRSTRPTCVVQPEYTEQVQKTIKEVRRRKFSLTRKNRDHSYTGASTTGKGALLDSKSLPEKSTRFLHETLVAQWGEEEEEEEEEEGFSSGESVDEEAMTDVLASQRWETPFKPPSTKLLKTGGPEGGSAWLCCGLRGGGAQLFGMGNLKSAALLHMVGMSVPQL